MMSSPYSHMWTLCDNMGCLMFQAFFKWLVVASYQFIIILMFVHVQIRLVLHQGIRCHRSFNGSLSSGCCSLVPDVPADPALVPGLVVAIVEGEQPVEQLVRSGISRKRWFNAESYGLVQACQTQTTVRAAHWVLKLEKLTGGHNL